MSSRECGRPQQGTLGRRPRSTEVQPENTAASHQLRISPRRTDRRGQISAAVGGRCIFSLNFRMSLRPPSFAFHLQGARCFRAPLRPLSSLGLIRCGDTAVVSDGTCPRVTPLVTAAQRGGRILRRLPNQFSETFAEGEAPSEARVGGGNRRGSRSEVPPVCHFGRPPSPSSLNRVLVASSPASHIILAPDYPEN